METTQDITERASSAEVEGENSVSDEEHEGYTQQFVTFKVGTEIFGLPIVEVQEIIRLPEVTRVPLTSSNLLGLSNLRGKVLPIISLRRIFGFPENEHDDTTRVLVIEHGSLLGFVVDQVSSVMRVEAARIEGLETVKTTVNTDYLAGIIKNESGKIIMILDFDQLIEAQFTLDAAAQRSHNSGSESLVEQSEEVMDKDTLHFVSFSIDTQEYAIPIEFVQEIVQVPEQIAQVPNSPSHVIGVINLRERLLPLVGLRQLFALTSSEMTDQNRIVVVHLPGGNESAIKLEVGIVVDTVNEVLRVDRKLVDSIPKVLSQDGTLVEITEIGRLDGGKRLVSFISAENLFQHQDVRSAIEISEDNAENHEKRANQMDNSAEEQTEDERQVVIFRVGNEEYGVPIEAINEIVRVPDVLTRIPTSPSFVEGIINLRGSILPVIDQRKRFGMPPMERSDRQRIMVFSALGIPTGFIVDSVSEVYKIANTLIQETPGVSGGKGNLVKSVANLEKDQRMVLMLDVDKLLDTDEFAQLTTLAAA
jgi:purine-binding chemotaxis protein CheW